MAEVETDLTSTRRKFIRNLFSSETSEQLYGKLARMHAFSGKRLDPDHTLDMWLHTSNGYTVDEMKLLKVLPNLLLDPQTGKLHHGIRRRVARLPLNGTSISFPLALLYSQIPIERIEEATETHLESVSHVGVDFHILSVHRAYSNCAMSEAYLNAAMDKREVISVYGGILVKDIGQNVGLCYKAVTDGNHTFVPGFWYGLCGDLRTNVREALTNGVKEITAQGVWVITRPCNGDILDKVESYLSQ